MRWEPGDVVFLAGTGESIRKANRLLTEHVVVSPVLGDGDQ